METVSEPLPTDGPKGLPTEGLPFFLWWMGGSLICHLFGTAAAEFIRATLPPSSAHPFGRWGLAMIPPAILSQAWQACLLFRRNRRRMAIWIVLPLLNLPFGFGVSRPFSVISLGIEFLVLRGVRRRPWLWLVGGCLGMALSVFLVFYFGHLGEFERWVAEVFRVFPSWVQKLITIGPWRAVMVVSDAIMAAALAWKMRPYTAIGAAEQDKPD